MISRESALSIQKLAAQFPIVVITGARQVGKTTLIRNLYPQLPYVNMERPDVLAKALDDPKSFLDALGNHGAIIDEAQRFPALTSWLQVMVDQNPRPGQFFLTGSHQAQLKAQASQSLAGRAAYLELPAFQSQELSRAQLLPVSTSQVLFQGFYPPLYDRPFDPLDWYAQYVQTYLEKDLTQLIQVKNLRSFHRFLQLSAGRTGQILNLSELARDADVSHTTIKHWLSLLEASFLIFFLPPWHENFSKRLVKSPKLYFYDVGLASHLAGVQQASQWDSHPLYGAFFETLVVSDLVKRRMASRPPSQWYFWSSPGGPKVDILEQRGASLQAYEVKSTKTFRPDHLKNLLAWSSLSGNEPQTLTLIYDGEESFDHRGCRISPWRSAEL